MDQKPPVSRYYYRSAADSKRSRQPLAPRRSIAQASQNRVSRKYFFTSAAVVVMLLGGMYIYFLKHNAQSAQAERSANTVKQAESKPPRIIDTGSLTTQVNQLIAAHPELDISVSTIDLASGDAQNYGVGKPFIAASTAKLITATMFLQQVEQGRASLDDVIAGKPTREQLRLMIVESDNVAWKGLNDLLTHEAMAVYAKSLGMIQYDPDGNTVISSDIARLLSLLYTGKILDSDHTKWLLSCMQNANEAYIAPAVTNSSKVYHKGGYLNDRAHDAAIIDDGKHAFVLVIFTKARNNQTYNFQSGISLFRQFTDVAVKIYQ